MSDSSSSTAVSNDPSLKRCFKYMLTNRLKSVRFTSREIREIIEVDLGIKLQPAESLYARVCIEAFAYYMQSWPEWNLAIKSPYHDISYDCLITYLRNKLRYLKQREANFKQGSFENNTVTLPLPGNMHISMVKGMKKVRAPYSLKVHVPESMMNTDVGLRNFGTNHVYLDLSKPNPSKDKSEMDIKFFLNFPFVYAELNIPGLINFSRSCSFKIERYLGTQADDPIPVDTNHIISVENTDSNSPHKVYSYQFMTLLFNSLNRCLGRLTINEIDETLKHQIAAICDAFLKDIFESNIKNTTVCEGSTVKYNIGQNTYYIDHDLSTQNILNETLVFKKMVVPVFSYNLISCDLNSDSISEDGTLKFFSCTDNDKMQELVFLHRIKSCLKFKCLICDAVYNVAQLQLHMKDNHNMYNYLRCMKCKKYIISMKLLTKRWQHYCNGCNIVN